MEKQTFIVMIYNLLWGVGISSLSLLINPLLKNFRGFYKSYLKYSFKGKQLKSWERIEKKKRKAVHKKKKAPD